MVFYIEILRRKNVDMVKMFKMKKLNHTGRAKVLTSVRKTSGG